MDDEEQVQERDQDSGGPRARLDKWLWAARFFKARALATQAVEGGRVKVNGERAKPSRDIRIGDRVCVQVGEFEWEVDVVHLSGERVGMMEGDVLYEETDDSRDRRAIVIANRHSNGSGHSAPSWARGNGGGDATRNRQPRPRRTGGNGRGNRGATAAFLSPETSPSQLVAAITGNTNGASAPRPAPANTPVREPSRKPRRRRRGRGGRTRGPGAGGEGGNGTQQA